MADKKYNSTYEIDLDILEAVKQGGGGGGGIPDAPRDGNTYGRKDGAWAKVEGGSGGGKKVIILDDENRSASAEDVLAMISDLQTNGVTAFDNYEVYYKRYDRLIPVTSVDLQEGRNLRMTVYQDGATLYEISFDEEGSFGADEKRFDGYKEVIYLNGRSQEEYIELFNRLRPQMLAGNFHNFEFYWQITGESSVDRAILMDNVDVSQENWLVFSGNKTAFANPRRIVEVAIQNDGVLYYNEIDFAEGVPQGMWETLKIADNGDYIEGNGYWLQMPFQTSQYVFANPYNSIKCTVGDVEYYGELYAGVRGADSDDYNALIFGRIAINNDVYEGCWKVDREWNVSKVSFAKAEGGVGATKIQLTFKEMDGEDFYNAEAYNQLMFAYDNGGLQSIRDNFDIHILFDREDEDRWNKLDIIPNEIMVDDVNRFVFFKCFVQLASGKAKIYSWVLGSDGGGLHTIESIAYDYGYVTSVYLTQAEYDAIETKDNSTLYIITD